MSVPVAGRPEQIPDVETRSYLDLDAPTPLKRTPRRYSSDPAGPKSPHSVAPLSGVVWHTVHGTADGSVVLPSVASEAERVAYAYARSFARDPKPGTSNASAHVVASDVGVWYWIADAMWDRTWHATSCNRWKLGIELDQEGLGIANPLLRTVPRVAWWLTRRFADFQAMIPAVRSGGRLEPDLRDVPGWKESGAREWRGHLFHANTPDRGQGDPGPAVGRVLLAAGFEGFDVRAGEDRDVWRARQKALGLDDRDCDGIPGPKTRERLRAAGHPDGVWAREIAR